MRRISGQWIGVGVGALLWTVALLLPPIESANAQGAFIPHLHPGLAHNPVAAQVRNAVLERRTVEREIECLALNVYWEARGEPVTGRHAVAAVTLNRVVHPDFPDSICSVVRQGASLGMNRCQFSWVCDRYGDRPRDRAAWAEAQRVAYATLFLDEPDPTRGALYFHATRVRPDWSRSMVKVGRIGRHVYYRERAPISAADESWRSPS